MQRILSAFAEAVRLYQEGNSEECRTILRSILEVDPSFSPGSRLMQAVEDGSAVDLGQLLGDVGAAGAVDTDKVLIEARQAFTDRDYPRVQRLVADILSELPGQEEARRLGDEAARRLRSAAEVEKYVGEARGAMRDGSVREVEAFLELARNLDPSHPGIADLEAELSGGTAGTGERSMEFELPPEPGSQAADTAPPEELFTVEEGLDDSTLSRRRPREVEDDEAAALPETVVAPAARPPAQYAGSVAPPAQDGGPAEPPATAGAAQPQAPGTTDAGGFEFASAPLDEASAGGFAVDQPAGNGFTEFGDEQDVGFAPVPNEAAGSRVQELLDEGQQAFDRGDYQAAVDTWSRIYLIEADNPEAERRITEARRQREEIERRADHAYFDAREAFEQGQTEKARKLCQEVLELVPQHLEAHDLLNRIDTPAAPPPPPSAAASDEDDLFRDDFVATPAVAGVGTRAATSEVERAVGRGAQRAGKRGRSLRFGLPMPVAALLGAVALLVLVVGFLLRSTLFGGAARVAEGTLAQAEEAARQGRLQEAINLLRSLQAAEQLEGDVANQVSQRIVEYQRRLKSKAAPTPTVQLGPIREALDAGERVKALGLVREGLARVPGDPELAALEGEIQSYSAAIASLADAVAARDMERVRGGARAVLTQHPEDTEATRLWRAATFNQAVLMLRRYEVGSAKSLLDALEAAGDAGSDVQRIQDFAERYVTRPVDPRYQIFVANVELRPLA